MQCSTGVVRVFVSRLWHGQEVKHAIYRC